MGEKKSTYRIFIEKPEGKGPLGKSNCRRNNNVKWVLEK
jgi:hypothetical protein